MASTSEQGERLAGEVSDVVRQFAPPQARRTARGPVQVQLDRLLAAQGRVATAAGKIGRSRETICGPRPGAGREIMRGPTSATDLLTALSALADREEQIAGELEADAQEIGSLF